MSTPCWLLPIGNTYKVYGLIERPASLDATLIHVFVEHADDMPMKLGDMVEKRADGVYQRLARDNQCVWTGSDRYTWSSAVDIQSTATFHHLIQSLR